MHEAKTTKIHLVQTHEDDGEAITNADHDEASLGSLNSILLVD